MVALGPFCSYPRLVLFCFVRCVGRRNSCVQSRRFPMKSERKSIADMHPGLCVCRPVKLAETKCNLDPSTSRPKNETAARAMRLLSLYRDHTELGLREMARLLGLSTAVTFQTRRHALRLSFPSTLAIETVCAWFNLYGTGATLS